MPGEVFHYNVVRNAGGDISIEGDTRSFLSLEEMVEYFRCSRGRLATRLRRPLSQATLPVKSLVMTRDCETYEIDRDDLLLSADTLSCSLSKLTDSYVGTYKHSTSVRNYNESVSTCMSSQTWRISDTFG